MDQQIEKTTGEGADKLEPQSDILLVLDKKKNKIEGVKGVDEEGNLHTAEVKKSNLTDFMRVDKGDAISNFFSNFWRRINDPISFRFFKAPEISLDEILKKLQNAIDNPTPEGNKLLDALEVKYNNKLKQEEKMEAKQETNNGENAVKQEYKYDVNKIDWNVAREFGLNQEILEKTGQLDKLLKGYKTDRVFTLAANIDGAPLKGDARLALRQVDDKVQIMMSFVRYKPDLESPFFGHKFTEEDKQNLLKTGNMGRVVEITNYDGGEPTSALISLDRFTKEPVSYPQEWIKLRDEFGGVKLSDVQKKELFEGKPVLIEGMKNASSGELFSKAIQFSADERKFVFVDDGLGQKQAQQEVRGIPDQFRGRKLTDKDKALLEKGKTVFLKDLLTNDKTRLYSGNLSYDKETGKLDFSVERPKQAQDNKQGAKTQKL
ncbi:hypothetical protein DRF65_14090 [Chryseobacterium pennae]|uniref:DUF3945 domain-containing protein n=1 Tax=Chryseobacterium pennae TaxID=2258962 RepID=A0A3D9C828_9FLAO|nr:DUF3945 domain-containing protein [Chryseobacterium pennae]REC61858.1 hypothetical protein DRF65_14090 [Chryseobacterium pennae]